MPPAATTVADALRSCAGELAGLAARCERLQHHLSPLLQRADDLEEAQALDLVTQSLAALGDYLSALAADVPSDCEVDPTAAARGLTLTGLADRLLGGDAAHAEKSGDLDMFGALP